MSYSPSRRNALKVFLTIVLFLILSNCPVFANHPNSYASHYLILSGAHTVSGEQKALVILVEFQDVHHAKSVQNLQDVAVTQLDAYYTEVSYGHISIRATVFGWYKLSHTMGYYGSDSKNPGDDDNLQRLPQDALAQLPASVDLTDYKYLIIVHAGKDQSSDQNRMKSDEIWSGSYTPVFPNYESEKPVLYKGKSFERYAFLSEFNGAGTFAHEWGHLFGLPDLYDSKTEDVYVGFWSLMDDGGRCCYNHAEDTPSYLGGWGATLLGWLSPSVGDPSAPISSLSLIPLESSQATAMVIPISTTQYYFVEERTKTGRDSHLPASGVLVFLADESLQSGQGILRLIDPKTGSVMPPQSDPRDLPNPIFTTSDHLVDPSNNVFLNFLSETGTVTLLYTTQPLSGSAVTTQLHLSNTRINVTYNEEITETVILVDEKGTPVADAPIQVEVQDASGNWQQLGSSTTNSGGGALIRLSLRYNVGTRNLRLYYSGGKYGGAWFLPSAIILPVDIIPAKLLVTIVSSPIAIMSTQATVTVTDEHGNPISSATVSPSVNGISLTPIHTDSTGKATFTVPSSQFGEAAVIVNVQQNNYEPSAASSSTFVLPVWILMMIMAAVVAVIGGVIIIRAKRSSGN